MTLFPGHGVPSCIVHPSSGTFWALATKALIWTLNSSYSLCNMNWVKKFNICLSRSNWITQCIATYYLHCSPLLHRWWQHLIFEVIHLLHKIKFRGPWLNVELLTERNPLLCKLRCFRQCLKCQHSSTIIRNITWNLVNRVVHCKDGKNRVCSHQRRFFQWINSTHKYVNWTKLRRLAFLLIPDKQEKIQGV